MGYPLKDKKDETITKAFQKILDESNCKPSKIWEDKGSEFYNSNISQVSNISQYATNRRLKMTIKNM